MAVRCSYPGCTFEIEAGTNPAIAGPLLQGHVSRAKPAPVRRPEISTGGSTEGWHYFLTRWRAYASAVHLSAEDIPVQLLECLEPNLRRDVRWAPHPSRGTLKQSCWQPSGPSPSGRRTPRWPGWPSPEWSRTEGNPSGHTQPNSVARPRLASFPVPFFPAEEAARASRGEEKKGLVCTACACVNFPLILGKLHTSVYFPVTYYALQ